MREHYHHYIFDGVQLTLPVTPQRYSWGWGKNIETINVSALGDVYFPGNKTRCANKVEGFFPAQDYPFLAPGAVTDPWYYVGLFQQWAQSDIVGRFIVDGTDVNAAVLIESIDVEEKDGSGDVYYVINQREWIDVEAEAVATINPATDTQNKKQPQDSTAAQTYTVRSGDCLSVICRRFYGDGTAKYYNALAKFNGIQNPHLIYPGTELTLPPADQLLGG